MKCILEFLNLQKEVIEGMTEKEINEKIDYIKKLNEYFENDPTDIKLRILDRVRSKTLKEISPHRMKRKKRDDELWFFAGQITPTEFELKKTKNFKSKEAILDYLDRQSDWEKEIADVIKSHTVSEILEAYLFKEKKLMEEKIESIKNEVKTLTHDLAALNKLSDYIVMDSDVQKINKDKGITQSGKFLKR